MTTTNTSDFEEKIAAFKKYLLSKRYSTNTIKTYTEALNTFLKFSKKGVNMITEQDLLAFNTRYILKKNYSTSFQNQVVNAVKLFFGAIENHPMRIDKIHRPKREKKLPNVLSVDEVKTILNLLDNLKHKMMLSLIYACGLRRSELLNLTFSDIQAGRNLLLIRQAKGKKIE